MLGFYQMSLGAIHQTDQLRIESMHQQRENFVVDKPSL